MLTHSATRDQAPNARANPPGDAFMPTRFSLAAPRSPAILFAACVLAMAACGGGGGGATAGGGIVDPPVTGPVLTTAVTLTGTAFTPRAIQVSPGATLTFTNNDGFDHNVEFLSGSVTPIGNFSSGSRTAIAPSAAGTYNYHCTIHAGMNGTVNVQ
jgi:plastocyanin